MNHPSGSIFRDDENSEEQRLGSTPSESAVAITTLDNTPTSSILGMSAPAPSRDNNNAWLAQGIVSGIASGAVWGALNLIVTRLYHGWKNYENLSANAPTLYAQLENLVFVLWDMKYILSDTDFTNALNDAERNDVDKLLNTLEERSNTVQKLLKPFLGHADANPDILPPLLAARSEFNKFSHALRNRVTELDNSIRFFKGDLDAVREEIARLIVRYQCQLSETFVQQSLSRTRHWGPNQSGYTLENPANFSEMELKEFNLLKRYATFEPCTELDNWSNGYEPPLRWYKYTRVQGICGYVLVEGKVGPYHNSEDRESRSRENDSENLRSVYGLVRQFKAKNRDYNDKFGVLPCQGFYYHPNPLNDGTILLIWEPPFPASNPEDIYPMKTLRESLSDGIEDSFALKVSAKRLVKAVYELLQSRWYHRTICSNNVVTFSNNPEKVYLVGFRSARFTDGHSDPRSRPTLEWKDRYFQHPDRYEYNKPTDCRFRMKHDIYGLGVLLLELQKGRYFGDAEDLKQRWEFLNGKQLRRELMRFCLDDKDCRLGQTFVSPITYCLKGFEELDRGEDAVCHPRVLHQFRVKVLDPLANIADNVENMFVAPINDRAATMMD